MDTGMLPSPGLAVLGSGFELRKGRSSGAQAAQAAQTVDHAGEG